MPSISTLVQRHVRHTVLSVLTRRDDDDDDFASSFDEDWEEAKDSFKNSQHAGIITAGVIGSVFFIGFCVIAALVWHRYVRWRDAFQKNLHNPSKTDMDAPPPYTFSQGYVSVPQNAYTGGLDVHLEPYGGSETSHFHGAHSHSHSHDTSGSHSHDTSGSYSGGTSGGGSGGMS